MSNRINRVKRKATTVKKTVKHTAKSAKKTVRNVRGSKNPLEEELRKEIKQYNNTYAMFNEHGMDLFIQRQRAIDLLDQIEVLINSIAKTPKTFGVEISDVNVEKKKFKDTCDYAKETLDSAKKSAVGAGTGIASGAAVAAVAPNAAMWIATTFGTASTGTAISALSGAAARNAALAWIGGGTLAAGGGGVAAGEAFLLMAGPIGWGVAGATLLTSVFLFSTKKKKQNEKLKREIESVKKNTIKLRRTDADLRSLLRKTKELREKLSEQFHECMKYYDCDFMELSDEEQLKIGTIVNNAKSLAFLLGEKLGS